MEENKNNLIILEKCGLEIFRKIKRKKIIRDNRAGRGLFIAPQKTSKK